MLSKGIKGMYAVVPGWQHVLVKGADAPGVSQVRPIGRSMNARGWALGEGAGKRLWKEGSDQ